MKKIVSIIIPCYNESSNIYSFYKHLTAHLIDDEHEYEILYVNDGSTDDTLTKLQQLAAKNHRIKIINLSRNFGKEVATTAGIHLAAGDALLTIDADGQHPVELIPEFVRLWDEGAQVVVGVCKNGSYEHAVKKYGSRLFYKVMNWLNDAAMVPGSTDFRLIDRSVRDVFATMTERHRITRGLIDWLGYKQAYVEFDAKPRLSGKASYSTAKLFGLALNSFMASSLKPLYFPMYMGAIIIPLSLLLAIFSSTEMLIGDPMHLRITGTAYLVILLLFLLGIVLISQGITSLYLSRIHTETQNRPLFVVDYRGSRNLDEH